MFSRQNRPICMLCRAPARPAVLMFADPAWVDNVPQRERYRTWLKAVEEEARARCSKTEATAAAGTPPPAPETCPEALVVAILDAVDRLFLVSAEEASSSGSSGGAVVPEYRPWLRAKHRRLTAATMGANAAQPSPDSVSSGSDDRLKVCVMEIGCGRNVATVRWNSSMVAMKLMNAGANCCIVRINPERPRIDEYIMRDYVRMVSVTAKSLESLEIIDSLIQPSK